MKPTPTPRVRRILADAEAEADRWGHSYVGTEHLLLALIADRDGVAGRVLEELDVAETAAARVREIMASEAYNA